MMTTLQAAQGAMRHLTAGNLAALPVSEAAHLVNALNSVMTEYLAALPAAEKTSPGSARLRAPLMLSLSILQGARGFAYTNGLPYPAGGYAREEDLLGHTVSLAGDAALNRLQRPGELLNPYLGPRAGDAPAIFYGDAVGFSTLMTTLHGDVWWSQGGTSRRLRPLPLDWAAWHELHPLEMGTPEYVWAEGLLRTERAAGPVWLLRVWPLPLAEGLLSFTLETGFTPLTLEDLHEPRTLPVPPQDAPLVADLLQEAVLTSPLLKENAPVPLISAAAERARMTLARKAAVPRLARPNKIVNAWGF